MKTKCDYCVDTSDLIHMPKPTLCLFYYMALNRFDGRLWAHYPECNKNICPKIHPELWNQEATLDNETIKH